MNSRERALSQIFVCTNTPCGRPRAFKVEGFAHIQLESQTQDWTLALLEIVYVRLQLCQHPESACSWGLHNQINEQQLQDNAVSWVS